VGFQTSCGSLVAPVAGILTKIDLTCYMLEGQSYIVVLERSIEECSTTLLHIGMTSYPLAVKAALGRIGVFAIVCGVCVQSSMCGVFVCVRERERERVRARARETERDRERHTEGHTSSI
jgi:hypothetical protein